VSGVRFQVSGIQEQPVEAGMRKWEKFGREHGAWGKKKEDYKVRR